MPTKEEVLQALATADHALTIGEIVDATIKPGQKRGKVRDTIKSQLVRFGKDGAVDHDGEMGTFALTTKGRQSIGLLPKKPSPPRKPPSEDIEDDETKRRKKKEAPMANTQGQQNPDPNLLTGNLGGDKTPIKEKPETSTSMVDERITPRDVFLRIGTMIGITPERTSLAADMLFTGDWKDLDWVAEVMVRQNIRTDLADIWVNNWANWLRKPVSAQAQKRIAEIRSQQEGSPKQEGKRDPDAQSFVIQNGLPVYLGENLGHMTYRDAVELCRVRAATGVKSDADVKEAKQEVDSLDRMLNLFKGMMELMGRPGADKKTYVLRPGEDGNMAVQEIGPDSPPVVIQPQAQPPKSYMIDPATNQFKELDPSRPIIIEKAAPQQAPQPVTYVIDQSTGELQEFAPGKPIILRQPERDNSITTILRDKDGNAMGFGEFIRLREFEGEEKRKDEMHKAKVETLTSVKEAVSQFVRAASRVAGD